MKRLSFLPLVTMLFLFACKQPSKSILTTSNLTSSFITIDAGKENTLKTPKGAVIKIAANSFEVPAGTKVSIEIKEAYSMQDILRAGLTTMSNGRPLQSGGMIYFNATAAGKQLNFLKPVGITIPSKVYNDSMQVFKGELTADSTINWIEPKPLDSSNVSKELAIGEALFKANCASCHHPYKDLTGPALAGSRDRAPYKDWPYKFINNTIEMVQYDEYAMSLKRKYGSVMTKFNLTARESEAILNYCDNETWLYNSKIFSKKTYELPSDTTSGGMIINRDCGYDTIPLNNKITFENTYVSLASADSIDTFFTERPSYAFLIDESGWYNIDMFINKNIKLVTDVKLSASVTASKDVILDVYLCIPSRKLLTEGHLSDDDFVFAGDDDGIQLIKGDEAFVYVLGLKQNKYYYGISRFTVRDEQKLVIELHESSRDEITEELRKNKVGNMQIDAEQPVIENFIKADKTGSSLNKNNTDSIKAEMQILKKDCNGDSTRPAPAIAFLKK